MEKIVDRIAKKWYNKMAEYGEERSFYERDNKDAGREAEI